MQSLKSEMGFIEACVVIRDCLPEKRTHEPLALLLNEERNANMNLLEAGHFIQFSP